MEGNCHHAIALNKACPWCKREKPKPFAFKKVWQYYQFYFNEITKGLANNKKSVMGPASVVVMIEDLNGEIYFHEMGETNRRVLLTEQYLQRLEIECSDQKSKSGSKNPLDLIGKWIRN